jgi:hypothetical protein
MELLSTSSETKQRGTSGWNGLADQVSPMQLAAVQQMPIQKKTVQKDPTPQARQQK